MAIFRSRDREQRREWKSYHASGIRAAKNHYAYSDPENGEGKNVNDAWLVYRDYMIREGVRHVTLDKFKKELHGKK
jgi:hypothetical protein